MYTRSLASTLSGMHLNAGMYWPHSIISKPVCCFVGSTATLCTAHRYNNPGAYYFFGSIEHTVWKTRTYQRSRTCCIGNASTTFLRVHVHPHIVTTGPAGVRGQFASKQQKGRVSPARLRQRLLQGPQQQQCLTPFLCSAGLQNQPEYWRAEGVDPPRVCITPTA